ncbi:hypothetical protein J3369_16895 [Alteromonas sp. NFXS44]|uniref:hypothetical protein n=1 Tax=Alteromonas sp. NFXS44 TaxID=2818435 RepID=UPI0032E04BF6
MFEPQDRIISMEVRQTDMRQGVDTFVVSAVSVDGVSKSHQFLMSQTDKLEFFRTLAASLDMEITYKPHLQLPMSPVIEDHPTFNTPADEQIKWRYMSYSKFMSLISSGSLWFARADILQASDPMEGRVPEAQVEANNEYLRSLDFAPMTDGQGNEVFSSQLRGEHSVVMNARREYFERYHTFINCWHIGDVENFAMWRVYGEDKNCLAIKSTVGNLRIALGESNNYRIYAGAMHYVDYSDPEVVKGLMPNGFAKYLNKSLFYKYEEELRLVFSDDGAVSDLIPNDVKYHDEPDDSEIKDIPAGVKVPVDVNQLINDVVLGPDCEPWFIEMLRELSKRENTEGLMERLGMLNIKLSGVKDYQIPNPPDINW